MVVNGSLLFGTGGKFVPGGGGLAIDFARVRGILSTESHFYKLILCIRTITLTEGAIKFVFLRKYPRRSQVLPNIFIIGIRILLSNHQFW